MKKILLFNVLAFTITLNAQIPFSIENIESGTFVDGVRTIEAADLDNDGDQDLVSAAINPSDVAYLMWYENDGIGNFTEHEISNNIIVANMRALKLIDIDNDGDTDILGSSDSRIINVRNNGDGTFTPLTVFNDNQIGIIFGIEAADLDFDGDLDIIVPGRGAGPTISGRLFWLRNDAGTFTEMPSLWNNSNNFNVKAFDFDNDNDTDIIATRSAGTNSVRVFINDGTGSFTNTILDTQHGAHYITIGDTDNDGTQEVLVSFEDRDQIRKYIYTLATDSWAATVAHSLNNAPSHIKIEDVNQDGNQDILMTTTTDNAFYWLEGDGSGNNFTPRQIDNDLTTTNNAIFMTSMDVDGDTDIDIIGAAASSDVVTLYRNTTPLSIDDDRFDNKIKVYPNPTSNFLVLEKDANTKINDAYLSEINGKTIIKNIDISKPINLKSHPTGIYFLTLINGNKKVTKKIIKK